MVRPQKEGCTCKRTYEGETHSPLRYLSNHDVWVFRLTRPSPRPVTCPVTPNVIEPLSGARLPSLHTPLRESGTDPKGTSSKPQQLPPTPVPYSSSVPSRHAPEIRESSRSLSHRIPCRVLVNTTLWRPVRTGYYVTGLRGSVSKPPLVSVFRCYLRLLPARSTSSNISKRLSCPRRCTGSSPSVMSTRRPWVRPYRWRQSPSCLTAVDGDSPGVDVLS